MKKSYTYDEYGNVTAQSGADSNPFRYCGEYYDEETGFIYLRARYYSPKLGRFISEDPARDDLNWYVYCGSNPINFFDPLGLYERPKAEDYPCEKFYYQALTEYYSDEENLYDPSNQINEWYSSEEQAIKQAHYLYNGFTKCKKIENGNAIPINEYGVYVIQKEVDGKMLYSISPVIKGEYQSISLYSGLEFANMRNAYLSQGIIITNSSMHFHPDYTGIAINDKNEVIDDYFSVGDAYSTAYSNGIKSVSYLSTPSGYLKALKSGFTVADIVTFDGYSTDTGEKVNNQGLLAELFEWLTVIIG